MKKIRNFIRKPFGITFVIFLVAGSAFGYWYSKNSADIPDLVRVERGSVKEFVTVTGTTKPVQTIDLAFEKGGRVERVSVDVGSQVAAGQILAELDSRELSADLLQAEASLAAEKAELSQLLRGTRPEEIRVQEVKLENAKVSLEDAVRNLADKVEDAYTKADDAVRGKANQFFSNPSSQNPQFNVVPATSQLRSDLEESKTNTEKVLAAWQASLLDARKDGADVAAYSSSAKKNLADVRSFLDLLASVINAITPTASISQTTIDTYRTDVSTARTNVNTAMSNLSAAEEKLRTAQSAVTLAENELALKKAGTTQEDIAAQEAQVHQAEAKIASIRAQLTKNVVRSPIQGLVTRRSIDPGEVASANTSVISIISERGLEIEVFVPEIDVGKVSVSDPVEITFDAFPGEKFEGKAVYIDPAETVVDGVVNFKTKVVMESADPRLKSGLTANLNIETNSRENVLYLPQYAVLQRDNGAFVRVLEGDMQKEIPITIGARGDDGRFEVLSGVSEGQQVLNVSAASGQDR